MTFKHLATTSLPIQSQLQWLLYSDKTGSFISGDDKKAFSLPISNPSTPTPLASARPIDDRIPPQHPCNLPIPDSLLEELTGESWHGFRFLESAAYERAADGDMLRTHVFGPNYGLQLLHPASGLILGLKSGSMELFERSGDGFKSLSKTKTRGSAALTFAAHPTESMIIYGDNGGNFHAHRFDAKGFGKAVKIAAKERKASRAEFVQDGQLLLIGGMGYLSAYSYTLPKFVPLHDVSISVRDFTPASDGKNILVNQGLHGISAYRYDEKGFTKTGAVMPSGAAREIVVSKNWRYMAVLVQDSPTVSIYEITSD